MNTTEQRAAIYSVAEPGIEVCRDCGGHTSYRDRNRGWCPWHGWNANRCGSACAVSRYCRCRASMNTTDESPALAGGASV